MGELSLAERLATAVESQCLQVAPATSVLSVSRVMRTGKRPVAYLIDIVPAGVLGLADLEREFSGSVLDLLLERSDLLLSHSYTDILIELADEVIAPKLQLRPGEPLHKLEAQLFTREGRVVDYSTSYFVPGYFNWHVIRRIGKNK
jgi:GntR family transcriptional regulator